MLKNLFITVAAAAAASVPLAGVAWADPDSNTPPGQNVTGQPGVPQRIGTGAHTLDPNQFDGSPVTPGSAFKLAKDAFPDDPTPVAYGKFLAQLPFGLSGDPTPPGQGTKTFTPGCSSGRNLNICTSG